LVAIGVGKMERAERREKREERKEKREKRERKRERKGAWSVKGPSSFCTVAIIIFMYRAYGT